MKKIKDGIIKFVKENEYVDEWLLAILVAIIAMLSFVYIDLKSLTIWTTNIWDVIAKGDITQYFAYTAQNIYHAPHQYVSGTLYSLIPWAIWNLPIWIIQYFFNKPILQNSIMLMWSQMFLVACLIGVIYFVKKITLKITKDVKISNLATFLTFSSIWIYIGVFYAGQNDIIICLLGLASIYALMKKKTKWFLTLGAFAISVKYFFIFPFIALVLLTEKKISKIILKIFVGVLPTLVFNIVCRWMPMFIESSKSGPTEDMFSTLFKGNIPGFAGASISLFVIGIIYVLFTSYITKPKEEELDKFIIYTATISFIPVLLFTRIQFYRMMLIMPFLIILVLQNKNHLKLKLIVTTIFEGMSVTSILFGSRNLFALNKVSFSILPKILELKNKKVVGIGKLIKDSVPEIKNVLPAFTSISVAAVIILVILNHPRFNDKCINLKDEKIPKWMLWIRPLTMLAFIGAMYYLTK